MKVLISGGGTGGHIFPALSIANALKRRWPDVKIHFVGANDRMEMQRVPAAGYEITGLPVAGFDRKKLWRNVGVLLKLWKSMRLANKIVKFYNPDIVIGVGGYASGPVLKAAQKAGIPTLLQEQNSYPGVTNKLLAQKAHAICVAYDGLEQYFPADKITLTGNPVRADLTNCRLTQFQAKEKLGFDPSLKLVLVVGGSLGARTINESIEDCMNDVIAAGGQILWQTGKYDAMRWERASERSPRVKATQFITDMALAYRAADVVVSRAGAGTISELEILGKACILVPSPNVAEDHQRKNAQALVDHHAAVMVLDADAPAELGKEIIRLMRNNKLCDELSLNIKSLARPNADDKIASIVWDIVQEKR